MTHSQTPWKAEGASVYDADGELVADCDWQGDTETTTHFLVRAANNHEQLLAALNGCLSCLLMDSDMEEDFKEEITNARAAIAAALAE